MALLLVASLGPGAEAGAAVLAPATPPSSVPVGEKIPSEDPIIKDFHSMGLVDGHADIFRCACPVRDLAKKMATTQPSRKTFEKAVARMQHLHELGIRTIISFQDPLGGDEAKSAEVANAVVLERQAARAAGIDYVAMPIANSGPHSLQTMSDAAVLGWLSRVSDAIFTAADRGGVVYHCSSGHDRTGIVSAYLRIKYQHWPVEQAIAEMRRLGHNWPKFSDNGGISSWHERHLRDIAEMLTATTQASIK